MLKVTLQVLFESDLKILKSELNLIKTKETFGRQIRPC